MNGGSEVNKTTLYLSEGTQANLAVNNATQPVPLSTSGPRYDFLKWVKAPEPCPGGTPFGTGGLVITDPLQADVENTYCACFEKQWYLSVTVNGSCTATPSGWVKEGDSVNFTATGTNVSVAVSGDATSASQSIVMNSAKSVTVTCTPSGGTGTGACSPLSSSPDLVGWYKFEEPSSQGAFAGLGIRSGGAEPGDNGATRHWQGGERRLFRDHAIWGKPASTVAGRWWVGCNECISGKVQLGTGAFSIDFWIRLDGSLPDGRPILQKMSGLADNQNVLGAPRPAAFGYRVRTVAGDLLQLTLASNSTLANYVDTVALPVGTWTQVTIVVPRTSPPVFYVNGTARTPNGPPTFSGSAGQYRSIAGGQYCRGQEGTARTDTTWSYHRHAVLAGRIRVSRQH